MKRKIGVYVGLLASFFLLFNDLKAQYSLRLGTQPERDFPALRDHTSLNFQYAIADVSDYCGDSMTGGKGDAQNNAYEHLYIRENWLPTHVRRNPAGYSFLCRLEREIEKSTPVGLWVRVGEVNPWEYYNRQQMYVQVKLFGFR